MGFRRCVSDLCFFPSEASSAIVIRKMSYYTQTLFITGSPCSTVHSSVNTACLTTDVLLNYVQLSGIPALTCAWVLAGTGLCNTILVHTVVADKVDCWRTDAGIEAEELSRNILSNGICRSVTMSLSVEKGSDRG